LAVALACVAAFGGAQEASDGRKTAGATSADAVREPIDETTLALPEEGSTNAVVAPVSTTGTIVRTVLVLALTAAAIYGLVYFIRRLSKGKGVVTDPNLKVLSSAHLGSNRFVHVISVGDRAWLVGSGDGGVSLISELEDRELIDAMLLEESSRVSTSGLSWARDFSAILAKLGGKGQMKSSGRGSDVGGSVRDRRERLTKL